MDLFAVALDLRWARDLWNPFVEAKSSVDHSVAAVVVFEDPTSAFVAEAVL